MTVFVGRSLDHQINRKNPLELSNNIVRGPFPDSADLMMFTVSAIFFASCCWLQFRAPGLGYSLVKVVRQFLRTLT